VVPVLMFGDDSVVGFDPEGIDRIISAVEAEKSS
jgi:hypothetical protein